MRSPEPMIPRLRGWDSPGTPSPLEAHYWEKKRWFTSMCTTLESSECISVSLLCPVGESLMFDESFWVAGVTRDLRKHSSDGHWHPLLRASFVHSKETAWFVLTSIAGSQTKPIPMYLSASFQCLGKPCRTGWVFFTILSAIYLGFSHELCPSHMIFTIS